MGKFILAVDDSRSILQMVANALHAAGFEVDTAPDGQVALQLATAKNYSMVITDLNMPGMDGFSLIRALREHPQYKFTPLVMLTKEANEPFKAMGKKLGASGWIVKPFDAQQLIGVVEKFLNY